MQRIKQLLVNVYGICAAVAVALCVLADGVLVLVSPGVMRRRRIARRGLHAAFILAGMPFTAQGLERLPDEPLVAYPTMPRRAVAHVCTAAAEGCDITLTASSPLHLA